MGTPGVPWNVNKASIVEALKKRHGRLTYAAKDLGCAYPTLKKRIDKDEALAELVNDLRNEFDDTFLDSAETVLMRAMNQGDDLGNAIKAAVYVLNNKGRARGYAHPKNQEADFSSDSFENLRRAVIEINAETKTAKESTDCSAHESL